LHESSSRPVGDELATLKRQQMERTIKSFDTSLHAPDHRWQDDLRIADGC
jgi:hypothetical protein